MEEHQKIIEYLKDEFPAAQVPPPRDYTSAAAPVFPVIEGYVERQLEICRPILDDFEVHTVVQMLRTNRAASTMRDQPNKRIVLSRDRCGELLLEVEPLRKA